MKQAKKARRIRPAPAAPRQAAGQFNTPWLPAGLIVLAIALVYFNSLTAPFTFDDPVTIVRNEHIQHLLPLTDSMSLQRQDLPIAGRPVASLSIALNYAVGGVDVRGYHVVNIALHALCALLLFGIVRRTLVGMSGMPGIGSAATPLAFACALIWALHPLQTEAVDYVSARTEALMSVFYLLTLYAGLRAAAAGRPARWLSLAVASCALAMGSKEVAITAPVVVVLYDRTFLFASFADAFKRRWKCYLGLAATWLPLAFLLTYGARFDTAGFSAGVTPWTYLLNQSVMLVRYLRLAFVPVGLVFDYGEAQVTTLSAVGPHVALVAGLAIATMVALVRWPVMGFLGAWFFVILAPTSSFVPIATEVGAERRMYLPLAAIIVLVVVGGYRLLVRLKPDTTVERVRRTVVMAVVLLCVALGVLTVRRNAEYQSALTLWQSSLDRWPTPRNERNVGAELMEVGRHDEALVHLRRAVVGQPAARFTLGYELLQQGQTAEGIAQLEQFIRERPDDDNVLGAQGFLANALASQGRLAEAAEHLRQILSMKPDNFDAQLGLANTFVALGRREDAAAAFTRAVALAPGNAAAERDFASFLLRERQLDAAGLHAQAAVRLAPTDAAAHALLGLVLASQRQFDQAVEEFQTSIRINPTDNPAREYLDRLVRLKASSPVGR